MKFTAFIERLEQSNKKLFAAERIQLTPDALRNILHKAFDAGHDEGVCMTKELSKLGGTESIFERMFGKS